MIDPNRDHDVADRRECPSRRRIRLCRGAVALVAALTVSTAASDPALATPGGDGGEPPVWALADDERELDGVRTTAVLRMSIPPGWQPADDGRLDLTANVGSSASGIVSIDVNGTPLRDLRVGPGTVTDRLDVPAELLVVGVNTIVLTADLDLDLDEACEDPRHPARRLSLGDDTGLTVPLEPAGPIATVDLARSLEPLGSGDRTIDVHIVGEPTGALASAAAVIVAASRMAIDAPVSVDVAVHEPSSFDADDLATDRSAVVLGLDADLAETSFSSTRLSRVAELERTTTGRPILVVGGADAGAVTASALQLAARDVDDRSNGATAGRRLTLRDLGYDDRTLRGPGRDSTLFAFDVPIDGVPGSAHIQVDAARSSGAAGLDGVGVELNGRRIGVATFAADGRTDDQEIEIPGDAIRPGRNLVRLDADFRDRPESCVVGDRPQSVDIASTSSISLGDARHDVALDLEDLPYLFRDAADVDALTVVAPTVPTAVELARAVDLAGLLGRPDHPAAIAFPDELDAEDVASRHLVLLGDARRQPLLDPIAGVEADPAGAAIRLVAPADAGGRVAMVVTGRHATDVIVAAGALLDIDQRGSMTGSAVSIAVRGDSTAISEIAPPVTLHVATDDSAGTHDDTTNDTADDATDDVADDATDGVADEATAGTAPPDATDATDPDDRAEAIVTPIEAPGDGGGGFSGFDLAVIAGLLAIAAGLGRRLLIGRRGGAVPAPT